MQYQRTILYLALSSPKSCFRGWKTAILKKEDVELSPKLHEICQSRKETANPRVTNQMLADLSGKSTTAIAQFFRGDVAEPSVYTVGPICKALGVSLDEYFDIESKSEAASFAEVEAKLESEQRINKAYLDSIRKKDALIAFLLLIVILALGALIYDLCNPNVGWIRDSMSFYVSRCFL